MTAAMFLGAIFTAPVVGWLVGLWYLIDDERRDHD